MSTGFFGAFCFFRKNMYNADCTYYYNAILVTIEIEHEKRRWYLLMLAEKKSFFKALPALSISQGTI